MARISSAKRLLSLVLALLMLVSILPPQTIAVGNDSDAESAIGKIARISSIFPVLWKDPTNNDPALQVSPTYGTMPALVKIVDVYEFSSTLTLYKLEAAIDYTWPAEYKDYHWMESTKLTIVDVCDKCGDEDCEKVHVFCPYCAKYDCGLIHTDPYQPYIAPVIPTNPTLTPGADVSIVDEYGDAVTDSFVVRAGKKYSFSAWTALTGKVSYQWQACYNNAKMSWVDLYGQTGQGILTSASMFRNLVDAQSVTYLRCVITNGKQTYTSDPICIFVDETAPEVRAAMFSTRSVDSSANNEAANVQPVNDVTYAITIKYVMKVAGVEAPSPWVVHLAPGEDYVVDVAPPAMPGFYAGDATGVPISRVTQTVTNIQAPVDITVYYWPDFVDFKVEHYHQKISDDSYELVDVDTIEDMKTGDKVGEGLAKSYTGFDTLPYDTTITVAADGSTVVKIYYDRQYFMIAIDLNGGYGAEPLYARYETPITIPTPKRTGYTFAGWKNVATGNIETVVATVPAQRMEYQAQWTKADTKFTVAFWYENANDTNYTFVGSVQLDGITGNTVNGSSYASLNSTSNGEHFDGFNANYAQHFTNLNADKTDKNVVIKADGSTVVNVYFYRNKYELTYNHWVCLHDHTSGCSYTKCGKTAHDHSGGRNSSCNANSCSYGYEHMHSTGCVKNNLYKVSTNKDELENQYGTNLPNGTERQLTGFLGIKQYYVIFDGVWYRCSVATTDFTWQCGGDKSKLTAHTHTTACCNGQHIHTQSCCSHTSYYNCDKDDDLSNPNHWRPTTYSIKFEADVGAIHKQMQEKTYGWRWVDMYFGGKATGENYGNGGAMGTFSSMPGGKTVFYQSAYDPESTLFEMQYWLETYDGDVSGTRYFDHDGDGIGSWFKKYGEPFYTRMSFVDWSSDYLAGLPAGFEALDCTFGDNADSGGKDDPYGNSLKSERESRKKYNNYYYGREKFLLVYFNGSERVAETTLMYDQPLTTDHNINILTSADSPYGAGYVFGGWYLDPECTVPVDWNNTRMPDGGATGDIGLAVYAKWTPIEHQVKTYLTKENVGGAAINTYKIFHGEMYDGTVPIPDNGSLSFIGWFYEEDGREVAYDFSMPVYRDMDLYAKWNSTVVTYGTIYYVDANGNELARPTTVTGMVGDTKTYSAKFSTELGDGSTLYFPNVTSHNIKFTDNPDQNTFTFIYTALPEVGYTIKFVDKSDTSINLFDPVTGTAKTATITYDAQANGKIKDKYYLDKNSKEFALSSDESKNVFYFYYTYDPGKATVQVEHYIQNLDGTGYEFHSESQPSVEELNTLIKAADRKITINGFTYDHATFNGTVATEQTLTGGLTIKLYYTRNSYSYTFRFVYTNAQGQQVEFPNSAVTGTAKYRANITQAAKSFAGYTPDANGKSIVVGYNNDDNVRTFVYSEEPVEIRYSVGAVKGGSVSVPSEKVSAVSGTPAGSTASVSNSYYVFTGWYTDYTCTDRVSTKQTFAPEKTDGVYVAKTYYAGFEEVKVTIKYQVEMPANAPEQATLNRYSELVSVITGRPTGGGVASIPNGYVFDGWYLNGTKVSSNLDYTPPRTDNPWVDGTTYVAKFVEKKATINYVVVGPGNVSVDSETVDIVTGPAAGATAIEDIKYGIFQGWYSDAECTQWVSDDLFFKPDMPAGGWAENQTYYAKFKGVEYTITWVDGFGNVIDSVKLEYGAEVLDPEDPTKEGYSFVGWSENYFTMPAEDVTVTAQWTTMVSASISNGTIDYAWEDYIGTETDGSFLIPIVPVGSCPGATLTFKPTEGYRIIDVIINGVKVDVGSFTADLYTYTVPAEGVTGPLNIVVITEYKSTSLTIRVTGCDEAKDPEHAFLFTVIGTDGVKLQVTVIGNGEVTIYGVKVDANYTVILERTWRYGCAVPTIDQPIVSAPSGNIFEFEVERNNDLWLDGNDYYSGN